LKEESLYRNQKVCAKSKPISLQINKKLEGKKEINNNIKMRIYKMVYLPTLFYGSEGLAMLPRHESRITGAEMRYLIKCKGKTRSDRIRNSQIRVIINREPVTKMADGRKLRWIGQLMRTDSNRKPRQLWVQELRGCKAQEGQGQNGKSICR
jgi:hypothetical protein